MFALATDDAAACLNSCLRHFIAPDASQVHNLGGDYRVPAHTRPLLRAALIYHQDRGASTRSVFAVPRAAPPGPSAMLGLIHRTARLTDLPAPRAARAGTGLHAAAPFAATYTGAVTIDRPAPESLHFPRLLNFQPRIPRHIISRSTGGSFAALPPWLRPDGERARRVPARRRRTRSCRRRGRPPEHPVWSTST